MLLCLIGFGKTGLLVLKFVLDYVYVYCLLATYNSRLLVFMLFNFWCWVGGLFGLVCFDCVLVHGCLVLLMFSILLV